jgi:5-methylcytosine-specific restriction endonuclease McrA
MSKLVWVEVTPANVPIRIFKSRLHSAGYCVGSVTQMDRSHAVATIRHLVFIRSEGFCEGCGAPITESSGHMHEVQHRGKGGEISLANSVFICPACHQLAHKDRNPRFTKKPLDI